MNRCPHCGAATQPYQNFCTTCGLDLRTAAAECSCASKSEVIPTLPFSPAPNTSSPAIPFFVWSLILFFFLNPLGAPLAVVASLYAAHAHAGAEKKQNLHMARLLCILSTIITGGTLLILIIGLVTRLSS